MPLTTFRRCVARYGGEHKIKRFSCLDQFLCMAFAQLTYRESLRDIEACLRAHREKLYHMGIRSRISRSTLADANEVRDWRIYADFAQRSDRHGAQALRQRSLWHRSERDGVRARLHDHRLVFVGVSVGAVSAAKAAVKLHTLLDLRGNIPSLFISATARCTRSTSSTSCCPSREPSTSWIAAILDFERLFRFHEAGSFFVTRGKANLKAERRYSHPVDSSTGLICDQTIVLTGFYSHKGFQTPLRRIRFKDPKTGKRLIFLTNNFTLPALTITDLYRCRWQVELFFKWIKQHLRIKQFYGTSENAVKTQIWIAVSVYVLVAIVKKRLDISASLYEMLQILSLTMFEKTSLNTLLSIMQDQNDTDFSNQLNLFN